MLKKSIDRYLKLFRFWLALIILLFFAEAMIQLLNIFYSGVSENWINAVYIVLVAFAGSALLAAMSLFWPDVQRLLEVMYGEELEK